MQRRQTPWFDRVDTDLGNEFNNTAIGIANGDDVQEAIDTCSLMQKARVNKQIVK